MTPLEITVSDEAFKYITIQRGSINDFSKDRAAWEREYRRSLLADMGTMLPFLPDTCGAILDVGSGLGGIDILLHRHYGNNPAVWLLDGEADEPVVRHHYETFSHAEVARDFMFANGVQTAHPIDAASRTSVPGSAVFDLVLSLQAWCFHFPPAEHLSLVKSALKPGGTLILDVRLNRDDWRGHLAEEFTEIGVAHRATKFERVVYRA